MKSRSQSSQVYEHLNKSWKDACKILLKEEVGNLNEYEGWLSEWLEPSRMRKSPSGEDVLTVGDYCDSASFVPFSGIDLMKKYPPLSINEIKDIDSILSATQERIYYAGNIVLGKSSNVEESTGIEDCNFALRSHSCNSSQDIAFCTQMREDRSLFGCVMCGESSFTIKCYGNWRTARSLLSSTIHESSDIYFSHKLTGCSECMFSFNLRAKHHAIGNTPLPSEKYLPLKQKLLSELAEELRKKKRLPNLVDFFPPQPSKPSTPKTIPLPRKNEDFELIEDAFHTTSELLLGKNTLHLKPLSNYLSRHVRAIQKLPSCVSGKDVFRCSTRFDDVVSKCGRMVRLDEYDSVSHPQELPHGMEKLSLSGITPLISPVAYYCPEAAEQFENAIECNDIYSAYHCYRASKVYFTKFTAFSYWARNCEYTFGCDSLRTSSFCIQCHNSFKLSRCFEVDTSQDCTGSYFLHNCENVHDSMFCFNTKNKRYAIGNSEVGKENFLKAKSALQAWLLSQLERSGSVELDIYNIGCRKP
ncbi:MAG: hypothetical protein AB1657_06015 [Candidatus Micrarchaeota archaeon]